MSKVIILIGKTGSGKSTLANVISGTDKFCESNSSASVTKEIQKEEFVNNEITYAVIDTVGIGDTQLRREEVLDKLAEAVYLARDGIQQILFVTNGRFDQFEMATFNLLRAIIFDANATNHTTIVRTKFDEFYDEEACQLDIKKMLKEGANLCDIINSCQGRIIHVNNPTLDKKTGEELEANKGDREDSREKMLTHLQKIHHIDSYKPEKLQSLSNEIFTYMEEKIKKREELAKKETENRKKPSENQQIVSELSEELKSFELQEKLDLIAEEEKKKNDYFESKKISLEESEKEQESKKKIFIELGMIDCENNLKELNETKELIERIQLTEGQIRKAVFNHIFNSIDDIKKVIGGNIFLNSIAGDENIFLTNKLTFAELIGKKKDLEAKLLEKKNNNRSLERIKNEIIQKEQELINFKKELLAIKEISEKWQKQKFTIRQAQAWAQVLKSNFDPEKDAFFCAWLRDDKKLGIEDLFGSKVEEIKKLKKDYYYFLIDFDSDSQKLFENEKNEGWVKLNFTKKEIKKWINAGANPNDYEFIAWLRDIKKETPIWVTNYQSDYQILNERFKKHGLCSECQQPNTSEQWCQACNARHLQSNFSNWTSHNSQIDQFVQKYQLEATEANKLLEWIPYEQFTNVEFLAQGGFGKVYQAQWREGNIIHWDQKNQQWAREKDHYYSEKDKIEWDFKKNNEKYKRYKPYRTIVLKSLTNSKDSADFLQETEKFKIIDDWFNNIVPCYGLSQDPNTGNYLMVMKYLPERDLRNYLKKNNNQLSLLDRFNLLMNIARGLKNIHQKNLVHRDFHLGNILKGIEQTSCLITDLGLCKPANEISQEEKIYGVLPYVAPEVLQGQPYTQAADIYSWAIVAAELLTGLPPYYDRKHDANLGVAICQGLRPQFQIRIPKLLIELIENCWDNDPIKRPTASEIERELQNLGQQAKFKKQIQEADWHNKSLPESVKFPKYQIHKEAIYTSRLLPTKEITGLLQSSNLSDCSTLIRESSNTKTLPTKQIVQLAQDLDNQQQSLILEIKKIEREINKSLTEEQKLLVSDFMQSQKKLIENRKNKEVKKVIEKIEEQLEQENFTDEEINKIFNYCKRFIKAERKLESEKLEAKFELLAIKEI